MNFLHTDFEGGPSDTVLVTFDHQANVMLMTWRFLLISLVRDPRTTAAGPQPRQCSCDPRRPVIGMSSLTLVDVMAKSELEFG